MNNTYIFFNFTTFYAEYLLIFIILQLILYLVIYEYKYKLNLFLLAIVNFLSCFALLQILFLISTAQLENFLFFSYAYLYEQSTSIFIIKFILIFFCLLLLSVSYHYCLAEKIWNFEFYLMILLSLLGSFIILTSNDLLSLYLGIELQSLSFYILATFKQYNNFSTEAGIKYFILGAFASGLLLLGFSFIYGFSGLTNFYDLELLVTKIEFSFIYSYLGLILGFVFVLFGLLFKISAAPFHFWSPDVYEGSPSIVTAIFSILPKIVFITILIKLLSHLIFLSTNYITILLLMSASLSLLVGTIGGLYQTKIKRLLAYSGITHVGFLLLGLAINTIESFYSVYFYLVVYMILMTTIFSLYLNMRHYSTSKKIKTINELIVVLNSNPVLTFIFCLTLFSVAGIPPLVGFFSKFYIFISGLSKLYIIGVVWAAILSVAASLYYLRLIKLFLFKQTLYFYFLKPINFISSLIISVSFLFNFFFFFWPNILINSIYNLVLTIVI